MKLRRRVQGFQEIQLAVPVADEFGVRDAAKRPNESDTRVGLQGAANGSSPASVRVTEDAAYADGHRGRAVRARHGEHHRALSARVPREDAPGRLLENVLGAHITSD